MRHRHHADRGRSHPLGLTTPPHVVRPADPTTYAHPVPSYRVRLVPGALHRGTDPADVLPAAVDAAREHTVVEAGTVEVVRGQPRVTVRYEAPDDRTASRVGGAVVARVGELVVVETSRVTRRWGARWHPL